MRFLRRQEKETRKWIPPPDERGKIFDLNWKTLPKKLAKKSSSWSLPANSNSNTHYYPQHPSSSYYYRPSSPAYTLGSTLRTQHSSSSGSSSSSSNGSYCSCGNTFKSSRPPPIYKTYSYRGDMYSTCATYNPTEALELGTNVERRDTRATVSPTDTIDMDFCAVMAAMPSPITPEEEEELYNPGQLYVPRVPPSPAFSFVSGATMAAGLLGPIRRNGEQIYGEYRDVKDGILDAEPDDAEALPLYEPRSLEMVPEMDSREIFQAASNPIHEMP